MANEEILGKCPLCKEGNIIERDKNFPCTKAKWQKDENEKWVNSGCSYSISKFGLKNFGKEEITADEVKELLEKGEIKIKLISEKTMRINETRGVQVDFKSQA